MRQLLSLLAVGSICLSGCEEVSPKYKHSDLWFVATREAGFGFPASDRTGEGGYVAVRKSDEDRVLEYEFLGWEDGGDLYSYTVFRQTKDGREPLADGTFVFRGEEVTVYEDDDLVIRLTKQPHRYVRRQPEEDVVGAAGGGGRYESRW